MSFPSQKHIQNFQGLELIHTVAADTSNPQSVDKALSKIIPDRGKRVDWLHDMKIAGYLDPGETLADDWRLSDEGENLITEGIAARESPSAFKSAMRERVLSWAYARSAGPDDMHDVDEKANHFWFYGRDIKLDDLSSAAQYLEGVGLVTARSLGSASTDVLFVAVGITAAGQDCVEEYEGNLRDYIRSKENKAVSSSTYNINQGSSSNLSVGDNNQLLSMVTVQDTARVIELGKVLREFFPVISAHPHVDADEASLHITELESATDATKTQRALDWLNEAAVSSSTRNLFNILLGIKFYASPDM